MKTWKRWLAIAAAVLVALIVVIAAPRGYRSEPTFDEDLRLPVTLRVSPGLWKTNAKDIREAITLWDSAAGCPAIQLTDSTASAVSMGWAGEEPWCSGDLAAGGATVYCPSGHRAIQFRRLEENAGARIAHELGHGLLHRSHDRPGSGIMAPSVEDFGDARVSDRDRHELRKRCQ